MKYINKTYKLSWISLNIVTSGKWSEFGFGAWTQMDFATNVLREDMVETPEGIKVPDITKCFYYWGTIAFEILWVKLLIHIHI